MPIVKNLTDYVIDRKEVIEDNQILIAALGDVSLLEKFNEMINKEVKDMISEAYVETSGTSSTEELNKVLETEFDRVCV